MATREKRGKGVWRRLVSTTATPGNWQFPTCWRKQSGALHLPVRCAGAVFPWRGKGAGSHWWGSSDLPSKAERWKLTGSKLPWRGGHSHHAAQHDHRWIEVRTIDTDVVVLIMMVAQALPCMDTSGLPLGWAKTTTTSRPWNSCLPRPTEGTCPPCVPSHDWLWHGISIRGAWQEICLGHMELVSRTDRFPGHPCHHASQHPGWHNALHWKICGAPLWPHQSTYGYQRGQKETLRQEELHPAHPTYQGRINSTWGLRLLQIRGPFNRHVHTPHRAWYVDTIPRESSGAPHRA